MKPLASKDTVVAISTAQGSGAIGVIRLSGSQAFEIAAQVVRCRGKKNFLEIGFRTLVMCKIFVQEKPVDFGLVAKFQQGHSYTGEDIVELHCHGGWRLLNIILAEFLRQGAKIALPGEFTRRAFLNGQIDLTQAEGVASMMQAHSVEMAASAFQLLEGQLYKRVQEMRRSIGYALSLLNVSIDFSDEGHDDYDSEKIKRLLTLLKEDLTAMVANADKGIIRHTGAKITICGPPNVGKSSLMNAILNEDRAIVDKRAGTTRDVIDAYFFIKGLRVQILDTAGIRHSTDKVEAMGIERSVKSMKEADLILWVMDVTAPNYNVPHQAMSKKVILVYNKSETIQGKPRQFLPVHLQHFTKVFLAAQPKIGLEELRKQIFISLVGDSDWFIEKELIINVRQKEAAKNSLGHIEQALKLLERKDKTELIAAAVQMASFDLSEVLGILSPEDILDEIFSKFCIGK